MVNTMLIANIIAWISCVVFFVVSIVTKKRSLLRNIKIAYLGILGYILISGFLYFVLDIRVGIEILLYFLADAICLLLIIITLIISKIRWKKLSSENDKKISRLLFLYLIPIALILISFAIELFTLQKADVLLIEQGGFLEPNKYYAITDEYCIRVSLGSPAQKQGKTVYPIYNESDLSNGDFAVYVPINIESQEGTIKSSQSQLNVFRTIAEYDGFKNELNLDGNMQQYAEIYMLGTTDYYFVTYYIADGHDSYYKSAIFLRDRFVDDIDASSPDALICYN